MNDINIILSRVFFIIIITIIIKSFITDTISTS